MAKKANNRLRRANRRRKQRAKRKYKIIKLHHGMNFDKIISEVSGAQYCLFAGYANATELDEPTSGIDFLFDEVVGTSDEYYKVKDGFGEFIVRKDELFAAYNGDLRSGNLDQA